MDWPLNPKLEANGVDLNDLLWSANCLISSHLIRKAMLQAEREASEAARKAQAESEKRNEELVKKVEDSEKKIEQLQDTVSRLEEKNSNLEEECKVLRQQTVVMSPTAKQIAMYPNRILFQTETPERVGHIQNGERTPFHLL